MYIFDSIPATSYASIYILALFILTLFISLYYLSIPDNRITLVTENRKQILAFLFGFVIILFIGLRPISRWFVDMPLYAHVYNNIYGEDTFYDTRGEWLFYLLGTTCKKIGLEDRLYFLVLATIYYGCMMIACWRLMRNNLFVAFLFCFASLSCFAYGVNGLRNGIACSLVMLSITFLSHKKWEFLFSLFLMFLAINVHRSTLLPSICAIASLLFIKNTKFSLYFWFFSIFISLIAGNEITNFFVNLGFDDRMEQYASLPKDDLDVVSADQMSGFRLDFIIYSIMPIIMVWYVTIKRNFKDLTYHIIATTYILSNAFWIMVIRSEQSNRFAYLSWFLYPLVIAYPLLRMNIWDDQDRKTALILLAYAGFTFFMTFVYYG